MPEKNIAGLVQTPLLYRGTDGAPVFVHDTYRDFFMAKYFAERINEGVMSTKNALADYFSDASVKPAAVKLVYLPLLKQVAGLLNNDCRDELFKVLVSDYFKSKREKFNNECFASDASGKNHLPGGDDYLLGCLEESEIAASGADSAVEALLNEMTRADKDSFWMDDDEHYPPDYFERVGETFFEMDDAIDCCPERFRLDWLTGINLAYEITQELDLCPKEIGKETGLNLSAEAERIVSNGYFFEFSGSAQTYIFHLLSTVKKKQLTDYILSLKWPELGEDFFFDAEAAEYICDLLRQGADMPRYDGLEYQIEDESLVKKRRKEKYSFEMDPGSLARCLRPSARVLTLLTESFYPNSHTCFYVSKVLAAMDQPMQSINILWGLLDWKVQENYDDDPPVPKAILNTIYDACLSSEKLWGKILSAPETEERKYLFTVMKRLAKESHSAAKRFLRKFPRKEKRLREEFALYGFEIELCDYLADFFEFEENEHYL